MKYLRRYNENVTDGYSDKFDKEWDRCNVKIAEILEKDKEFTREELVLLSEKELDYIIASLK